MNPTGYCKQTYNTEDNAKICVEDIQNNYKNIS
jgi:hypothetical protein